MMNISVRYRRIADKGNGIIYFKIDGLYRSKLGLPASRATDICGSYDSSKKKAGILSFSHADIVNDFDFDCCVWAGNFRNTEQASKSAK